MCSLTTAKFEVGDPNGNPDPFGAKAAGQARAGRIKAADVKQPAHGRQQIQDGDFVLANDKIAVVVEDKGVSDGYLRFGGGIIALDKIGPDGKMLGQSTFLETMTGLSLFVVDPDDISVMNDGSDGKAAVIRVSGPLHAVPFIKESLGGLASMAYENLQGAYEYVLEPGAEKVTVRMGLINATDADIDTGVNLPGSDEYLGFFQTSHNALLTAERGYDEPMGVTAFVGFDGGQVGFAYQGIAPEQIEYGGINISGFQLFNGPGFIAKACSKTLLDRHQIIVGGPQYDGLRDAIWRTDGVTSRAITGTVKDGMGNPVAGAWVHELDASGVYTSRALTDANGAFTIHAPAADVKLVPQKPGYPASQGTTVGAGVASADLAFGPTGAIHVVATEAGTNGPMPVRIQIIPSTPLPATPAAFGVPDELGGRLYQEFSVTGDATLTVPVGTYRVVVSHGYEWELDDRMVTVAAGETQLDNVSLLHSVDSTGVMCADFHIHSFQSNDASDPVEYKVRGALADGLDIPVSSEHEWVVDFQPYIQKFNATKWAFGVPSEELTTFTWGHFGVVPKLADPNALNNGAVDWLGHTPAEVFAAVKALPEKPTLIVNHPDSAGFQGYFNQAKFDASLGKGTGDLWDDNFDAIEVYNNSDFESNRDKSVADWFSLLNHGMAVWSVGSSDSHHLRTTPVGYPRTCLRVNTDDPTALDVNIVRDAAGKGQSTISGGLYMSVMGPNASRPGDIVAKQASADFTVTIEAPTWVPTTNATLETIVNGKTVSTDALLPFGTGPSQKFVNQVTVQLDGSLPRNWVVFHVKADGDLAPLHPGLKPFAASNPILFE